MLSLKKWIVVSLFIFSGIISAKGIDAVISRDVIGYERTIPDDLIFETPTSSNDSLDAVCARHYKSKNIGSTPFM